MSTDDESDRVSMLSSTELDPSQSSCVETDRLHRIARTNALAVLFLSTVAVQPAFAQANPTAFCNTAMADTIRNIFTLIQLGGPLIGGTIALGAIAILPSTPRADRKERLKEMRNQGVIWGVIVAPMGTFIIQFLLNNVVVGGSGCGF